MRGPVRAPGMSPFKSPTLLALAAIALWSLLALLGTLLSHVPPFLLTGMALLIGSVPAWPFFRQWRVSWSALALGVYGLFGYHFLLFMALRFAPAVEANLVNYLWPLGIVLMAPLFLPGIKLTAMHFVAACAGFLGAAVAILGDSLLAARLIGGAGKGYFWGNTIGYALAAVAAFIWAERIEPALTPAWQLRTPQRAIRMVSHLLSRLR